MDSFPNLKYVTRKGSDLDLEDLPKSVKKPFFKGVIRFFDKFLFTHPFRSFSLLIMFVAFPLSVFLTLSRENLQFRSEAEGSNLELSSGQIANLTPNKNFEINFEASGSRLEDIEFIEILSPSWFVGGSETGGLAQDGSRIYKLISYSGSPKAESSDGFALLARGMKTEKQPSCNGCDDENNYLYSLVEFNLNTKSCEDKSVWGRNPVGHVQGSYEGSVCSRFENECLVSSTWKKYDTLKDCQDARNAPQITSEYEDAILLFEVDCDGKVVGDTQSFEKKVEAVDKDGDIVRFNVNSSGDFVKVKQDSVEKIIKSVLEGKDTNYWNYNYSASLKGVVGADFIGKTYPVKVTACDPLGDCALKTINMSVLRRSNCEFQLPLTGNISVDISSPAENGEFESLSNIVWQMSGTSQYYVEVNLYQNDCKGFLEHIARFEKLSLDGSKGYAVSWDSRNYNDGDYCIKVLAREENVGSNWDASDQVIFKVRNDNQGPKITSSPPKTILVTGERFEYNITAVDPDGDSINYDVVGLPDWLRFDGRTMSGSTSVPGSYNFAVFVDDNHSGYDVQQITLNVSPPKNQPTNIKFLFPTQNSVLEGTENAVKWEASDPEGVSQIRLYFSKDQKNWNLIGSYGSGISVTNWDVSSLENGPYYLKLIVVDSSEQKVESSSISDLFYISNPKISPDQGVVEGEDTSMPAINNLTPEPDSEIQSFRPLISASLHPSSNASVNTNKVYAFLDDTDIKSICKITETDIFCEMKEDLDQGKHKAKIEITDTNEKETTEEWYFTILQEQDEETWEEDSEQPAEEDTITIPILNLEVSTSAFSVSVVLCCASFGLIAVSWLVYFIWSRSAEKKQQPSVLSQEPSVYGTSAPVQGEVQSTPFLPQQIAPTPMQSDPLSGQASTQPAQDYPRGTTSPANPADYGSGQ
ncbi:hypothetical protein JW766_02070 [Candidatus Dojkabacteria bacterium]|nr:hypothetical protein [Candidatus Dojkabacteria bacterium]